MPSRQRRKARAGARGINDKVERPVLALIGDKVNVVRAVKNASRLMAGDRGDPCGKAGLPKAVKQAGPVHGKAGLALGIAGVKDGSGTGMAQHAVDGCPESTGFRADIKAVKHGKADRLMRPAGGKSIAAAIPGARLVLLDGMGHDLPEALFDRIVGELTTTFASSPAGAR